MYSNKDSNSFGSYVYNGKINIIMLSKHLHLGCEDCRFGIKPGVTIKWSI